MIAEPAVERHRRLLQRGEARHLDGHRVGAGFEVGDRIRAVFGRDDRAREARALFGDRDGGAWQREAILIDDFPGDGPPLLGERRRQGRGKAEHGKQDKARPRA